VSFPHPAVTTEIYIVYLFISDSAFLVARELESEPEPEPEPKPKAE
jgi:hypothetical protein